MSTPAVVYGEALSNPQLRLMDIPAVATIAHAAGARLIVDNTSATPFCTGGACGPATSGWARRAGRPR